MKKIITLTLILLSVQTVFGQQPTLFVQQAKSALFTPQAGHCYTLTLIGPKAKVLYFASAPKTNIGSTSNKELFYAWKRETKILNGAFVATTNDGTEHDYAFKISNPSIDQRTQRIEYTVCPLATKELKPITSKVFNDASIFIDPIHHWPP